MVRSGRHGDSSKAEAEMKQVDVDKRWSFGLAVTQRSNFVKPSWERESKFRANIGRAPVKSQQKKRKAAKR